MTTSPYTHPDIDAQIDAVRHNFTNHPPGSSEIGQFLDKLTEEFIRLGQLLVTLLPDSREKSLALTKLEECSMWAKAAVARNQDRLDIG